MHISVDYNKKQFSLNGACNWGIAYLLIFFFLIRWVMVIFRRIWLGLINWIEKIMVSWLSDGFLVRLAYFLGKVGTLFSLRWEASDRLVRIKLYKLWRALRKLIQVLNSRNCEKEGFFFPSWVQSYCNWRS